MKTLFTTALMLVVIVASAQLKTEYQEVVDQPGNQEQLHARAREWFITAYADVNKSVQMDDPQSGQFIGKGLFSVYLSMNTRYVHYNITIEAKDNKYRYSINSLILDWGNGVATSPFDQVQKMYHKKLSEQSEAKIQEIIKSLKAFMATEKSDW
jgi:hypothetical protein